MSIKTVLTYTAGSNGCRHRLSAAIEVARQVDAHLTVLAFAFEPDIPPALDEGATIALSLSTGQPDAEERARTAADSISRAGLRGEADPVVCPFSRFARELGNAAQFTDLVVLGRPYGEATAETESSAFEGALFDGDAAVIAFPNEVERLATETVLIAWNGSREALRAVRRGMPLLSSSKRVEIAIFGPSPSEPMPGERLATMLSRQGIPCEIMVQIPMEDGVTASLRRRVLESGADLVVMGAYSHSRFREYVIGGVTREYLSDFAVPVLMAH